MVKKSDKNNQKMHVLDIIEYIKQLENLEGGKIPSTYICTFSKLWRDRKTYVKLWATVGGQTHSGLS